MLLSLWWWWFVGCSGWRVLEMCDWYDIYLSACIIIPYEGIVGRCGLAAGD